MIERRDDIVLAMAKLSKVYQEDFSGSLVEIWHEVLGDLTPDEVLSATNRYLRAAHAFFPKPGQIYELARPPIDREARASLVADEVINLLGPCGADDSERAMNRLSEPAKDYIRIVGGWSKFAKSMQEVRMENVAMIKAQIRKSVAALQYKISTQSRGGLEHIGQAFKAIGEEES